MNHPTFRARKTFLVCAATLIPLGFLLLPFHAQTPQKKNDSLSNLQQELVRTETGFFEAWKMKDQAYFREHIAENGIFWGESGTFSRAQQLQEQEASAKVCKVEGYGLSDFGVLPLTEGAYLLTYKAEQYATCNGEKVPVHMNGSSIYILKAGHWQAIYRAAVPLKNQS
jgi:hypothetical protein